ncbi:MAG: hypothetical protein NVSMB57_09590 [Actinomycetota bacterium]
MDGSIVRSAPVVPTVCAPDPTTVDPKTVDPNDPVGWAQKSIAGMGSYCVSSPIQVDGHIDGTASSSAGVKQVELIFTGTDVPVTSSDVFAPLDCTDLTAVSCTWSLNLSFPLAPGHYSVQAEVTDLAGAQSVATPINIVVV